MHYSSMKNVGMTEIEAGLDVFRFVVVVVVVGEKRDSRLVNFRYCPARDYGVASWACQSWTAICCHTPGMNF